MIRRKRFANLFRRRGWLSRAVCVAAAVTLMTIAGAAARSDAATTLRVNKTCDGTGGCYPTIQEAIDAVKSTDAPATIVVAPGKYTATCGGPACSVASILNSAANGDFLDGLTLKCRHVDNRWAVLDATGLDHGVYISGEQHVEIQGCVVENADREGILVEDSNNVTIKKNVVKNNDEAMANTVGTGPAEATCPTFLPPGTTVGSGTVIQCCPDAYATGPGNFPDDNDDCGEGIHLRSVRDSVIERNSVHGNIGGILLTDETGPNEGNLIAGNNSSHNRKFGGDCGVTLASHTECSSTDTDVSGCTGFTNTGYGVFHDAVVGNVLQNNGAFGAGVFANPGAPPGASTKAYGNLISENVVKYNDEPGIGIHVHAENGNADNNTIIENIVAGNGGDGEAVAGLPPPGMGIEVLSNGSFPGFGPASPIAGTTISQNRVSGEPIDVWVGNTRTSANVFLNDLNGAGKAGVENAGAGLITATDDWWGCRQGPGKGLCSDAVISGAGTIISTPHLHHSLSPED